MATKGYEVFGTRILPGPKPKHTGKQGKQPKRADRLPCYGLAQLEMKKQAPRIGIVSDVSTSGAFIWMERAPRTGTRVSFALLQPGSGEAFRCEAVIRRSSSGGVGVSFAKPAAKLPRIVADTHVG
jgi:hypothetical protein